MVLREFEWEIDVQEWMVERVPPFEITLIQLSPEKASVLITCGKRCKH